MKRLAFLVLLAACTSQPVAPPPQPAPDTLPPPQYPAATRDRMMAILNAEWHEWGARTLDARHGPPPSTEGPLAEQHPAAFSKVLAYWSAAGAQDFIDRNKRAFITGATTICTDDERATDGRDLVWGCQPWSAAFISHIMRSTGIDRAEFPPAIGHRTYIDALIALGDLWGAQAPFLAHDIADYAPRPGDLICADRARRNPITTIDDRRRETGASRPMHCDIVIDTAPGELRAIGGNVAQAVTAVRYQTDALGRLTRTGRRWFVVFENRIGLGAGS